MDYFINRESFVYQYFSKPYIEEALSASRKSFHRIFNKLLIKKSVEGRIFPSNLFFDLNYDYEFSHRRNENLGIYNQIDNLGFFSVEIQQLLISYYLSTKITIKNDGSQMTDILDDQIATTIHDLIPDFIKLEISVMIHNFCSEFDLSDSTILIEDYNEILQTYSSFKPLDIFI